MPRRCCRTGGPSKRPSSKPEQQTDIEPNRTFPNGADPVVFAGVVYPEGAAPEPPLTTHWPALSPEKAATEWHDLYNWVQSLIARFEFLDHHVIPDCWWRHNQHVEALAALRDHERGSFQSPSTPAAAVEWLRALRDVATILRHWTADLTCTDTHRPSEPRLLPCDTDGFRQHVAEDRRRRRVQNAGGTNPA